MSNSPVFATYFDANSMHYFCQNPLHYLHYFELLFNCNLLPLSTVHKAFNSFAYSFGATVKNIFNRH